MYERDKEMPNRGDKASLPKEHFEETYTCNNTSNLKYSGDNVAELKKRSEELASYMKVHEEKHT
jgi:hypothetical protein